MSPSSTTSSRSTASTPLLLIAATVLVYLASALGGFALGFAFVQDARGGVVMAVVAGLNAGLFCTLLADWLLTRLVRRRPAR